MEYIPKTNHLNIIQSITNALMLLWPEGIQYEKVLLLVTDAANYMKLSGKTLISELYPNMTHVTCLAHALHNVCEQIRNDFPEVNRLVSCGKKIFVKCNSRREYFRNSFPLIPLPPQPVKTRWGSWLNAVEYYAKYYQSFIEFVNSLNPEDSVHIKEAQKISLNASLACDLAYINANFQSLVTVIKKLESNDIMLFESLYLVQSVYDDLKQCIGKAGKNAFGKIKYVLDKNNGYKRLKLISDIINGKNDIQLDINLTSEQISAFKFAPITSCEVERSFSKHKLILSDRRLKFVEHNLKYYFIVNAFYCDKPSG
jgi:hypothetical protein